MGQDGKREVFAVQETRSPGSCLLFWVALRNESRRERITIMIGLTLDSLDGGEHYPQIHLI